LLAAGPATVPAPTTRCAVDDPLLAELSGLVVDGTAGQERGLWAMADGGRRVRVHRIDPDSCAVLETRTGDVDPLDPEDLARGPDGTLWVGDIGDNGLRRDTVAVIELPADGPARLHRLTYPDGPHDAEALLVDSAGRPIVVIKDAGGPAGIYRTEAGPNGVGPTPLVRVGEVVLPPSDTVGGPIGGLGSRVVTGAAATTDGRVVALRSYTDAWMFRVPDGDVVAALTGRPLRVPLPNEPQGEAIAFDPSGALISGSETRGGVAGEIRQVPDVVALIVDELADQGSAGVGAAGVGADNAGSGQTETDRGSAAGPTPEWLPALIGAGVLGGLLLVVILALALRGARRH
jgi:hypothetical protein